MNDKKFTLYVDDKEICDVAEPLIGVTAEYKVRREFFEHEMPNVIHAVKSSMDRGLAIQELKVTLI